MTALIVLRNKAIKPLLATARPLRHARGPHNPKRSTCTIKPSRVRCAASSMSSDCRLIIDNFFQGFAPKRLFCRVSP
jgi:hypothetical protein